MELFVCIFIGFIFFIFIFPLLGDFNLEQRKSAAWQQFAQANRFTFVPGQGFGWNSYVMGNYKGSRVTLETIQDGVGNSKKVYTRLRVETNFDGQNNPLLTQFPAGQELSAKQVEKLLSSDKPFYLGSRTTIQGKGQFWVCDLNGYEMRIEYLQDLLNFLVELSRRYSQVLSLGGDIVPALQQIASSRNSALRPVALQLLEDIAKSTFLQFKSRIYHSFCPNCLVRYSGHKTQLPWWHSVTYYGCRTCGQSRQGVTFQGPLVAVLDSQIETEMAEQQRRVRVNWLCRRKLFDFEWVEIINATDEEVERFAVQVGNDTDEWRKPRYSKMTCVVSSQCGLSENTLRILERMFGKVKVEGDSLGFLVS